MARKLYSAKLLREFDLLTLRLGSRDQLTRITARLRVPEFIAKHGQAVCDAMFEELQRRDNNARTATGPKERR
jgi:hypothetical protein